MCTAILLRAYALTVGFRKDRKVLTRVVTTTRQTNWGLEGEGLSCRGWGSGWGGFWGARQSHMETLWPRWRRKGKGFQGTQRDSEKGLEAPRWAQQSLKAQESVKVVRGPGEARQGIRGSPGEIKGGNTVVPGAFRRGVFEGWVGLSRVRRELQMGLEHKVGPGGSDKKIPGSSVDRFRGEVWGSR